MVFCTYYSGDATVLFPGPHPNISIQIPSISMDPTYKWTGGIYLYADVSRL